MMFEEVMEQELTKSYIAEYGADAWNAQSASENQATLHELLMGFLAAVKNNSTEVTA